MKVADLFIAIGIEGASQVKNTLGDTRKGLNETTSSALFAKAAIIGVLYGLESLVSTSNQAGSQLQQFADFTGLSAERLQRYAYAGRQFGASADEIKGSLQGVQKVMSQLETTGQGPAGLWVVSKEVGLDRTKLRDTAYVFEQLQKFAQQSKLPIGIANQALQSFGLSEGTIAAMRHNAFNPQSMAHANIYSAKEIANLQHMNAAWGNLSDKIEKAIGHLNVKHGGQLIRDISQISDKVITLTDRLITLADKLQVFKAIGKAFQGWSIILDSINGSLDPKKKEEKPGFLNRLLFDTQGLAKDAHAGKDTGFDDLKLSLRNWTYLLSEPLRNMAEGGIPAGAGGVSQTMNFYGPAEPRAVGAAAKSGAERGVSDSVRQSHAQKRKN